MLLPYSNNLTSITLGALAVEGYSFGKIVGRVKGFTLWVRNYSINDTIINKSKDEKEKKD